MTTNVYDSTTGVLTTDSRWSVTWGNYVSYVDDVPYEKLERFENSLFMFAGKGKVIQLWKDWIRTRPTDPSAMPKHDGMSVCIVDIAQNKVSFSVRQDIVKDGAYFAGSGSFHAATCWVKNRCARKAIETAKERDYYTGGEVKFFETRSGNNNLHQLQVFKPVTIEMVAEAIFQRGTVMTIAQNNALNPPFAKLQDLIAANDADALEISAKLANGELEPEAPCDGMLSEWTQSQKDELSSVLGDIFGWKKAST